MEDNKELIIGGLSFLGGIIFGVVATKLIEKRKNKQDESETEPAKEIETENVPVDEFKEVTEIKNQYREILKAEGYSDEEAEEMELAAAEFPHDDLTTAELEDLRVRKQMKDYRDKHKGKIEMMTEDEWDTDFPEEDYYPYELWYFPEEDILTNEDGDILTPIKDYVGNIFEKTRFAANDWEFIYIRNHPKEEKYKIHKESGTRKDFFYYLKEDEE